MSTALTTNGRHEPVDGWTPERIDLCRRMIAKGCTDDEFAVFMAQCQRTGLDPFSRQIHALKRWNKKENREVLSIQTGIDGYRLIAQRTGDVDGQDGPYWCGEDGAWRDVWTSREFPVAAKVLVYRKGCTRPFTGIALWDEYCQTDKSGNPSGLWAKMPANQLAKCGEALALRKAFPQELSGIYTSEEMDQADNEPRQSQSPLVHVPPPPPAVPPTPQQLKQQLGMKSAAEIPPPATVPEQPDPVDDGELLSEEEVALLAGHLEAAESPWCREVDLFNEAGVDKIEDIPACDLKAICAAIGQIKTSRQLAEDRGITLAEVLGKFEGVANLWQIDSETRRGIIGGLKKAKSRKETAAS